MLVPLVPLLLIISGSKCSDPLVKTPLGEIRGRTRTSHDGRKFAAFEGIPFAKPPIGSRRFEPPEPIDPWSGTWDASHATTCAQTPMLQPNVTAGHEDCLHLNIYVPRESPSTHDRLEVMVHIHGGAFMYCSGHFYAKPDFIMDRDLVLVTFNYRLGVLGFLGTEDEVVPGNMGLKDQVMALKWVKNNIGSFGGNPDSVTLTGFSAGGSSVHLHYFSPMSHGLFQRGVSHSGTATNFWALQQAPLEKASRLGEALGCPIGTTKVLVDCLKERPLGQVLSKATMFFGYQFMPLAPFAPVVEKKGPSPFLTSTPLDLLKQGKVSKVPWLVSNTAHEGLFQKNFLDNDVDNVNQNWDSLAPIFLEFNYTVPSTLQKNVSEKIREYYFGENQILAPEKLVKLFSDRFFLLGAETGVKLQSKINQTSIFYYLFSYPSDSKMIGHGDDAKYFFTSVMVPRPLTQNELKMKNVMLDMLVSFAKTGVPEIKGVEWKPTRDQLWYLDVGSFETKDMVLRNTSDLTGTRKFWNSLAL